MGQLIKATTVPFQAIHFREPARLVSSDSVDLERRKVIARHHAMCARLTAEQKTIANYNFARQLNLRFKTTDNASAQTDSLHDHNISAVPTDSRDPTSPVSQVSSGQTNPVSSLPSGQSVVSEPQAIYNMQRGSFEFRVLKGDLSYLPPLDMTIITQYPDVEFEYLGDSLYVPPQDEETLTNSGISI